MRRATAALLFTLLFALPVLAQTGPDYAIRNIRSRFADSNRQAVVEFEVLNLGGAANRPATVTLKLLSNGQQVATQIIQPLKSQEVVTVSLPFSAESFPPGSTESMRVAVGVGEVEAEGSQNIQNNFAQISVTFPQRAATTPAPNQTPQIPAATVVPTANSANPLTDLLRAVNVDTSDPAQLAILVAIVAVVVILLLLLILIIRLLFSRPPEFGTWQPPYANMPPLDPNTPAGRRQGWQLHAQNGSVPNQCSEGTFHVRKLPIGLDGAYLSGWRITALRVSQYDMYGRIARSQALGTKRMVRQLNALVRRRDRLSPEQVRRRLLPVGRGLVGVFRKRLNDRNMMLPVALDVRFQGRHGEVRILFELFECRYGNWHPLDQWEPDMTVIGKLIHESYSYPLYGLRPGETPKQFRNRLADDMAGALAEMAMPQSLAARLQDTPTNPHQPVV
jgi:hypothetical protein